MDERPNTKDAATAACRTSPRLAWIDRVRGIGIVLVVWGHFCFCEPVRSYIYAFHIPLFFFVSGYLLDERKYGTLRALVASRGRRLLVPYVAFGFLTYLCWLVQARLGPVRGLEQPIALPIAGLLYSSIGGGWLNFNIALWFLTGLFSTEILYGLLRRVAPQARGRRVAVLICSVVGYGLGRYLRPSLGFPWGVDIALTAVVFYAAGQAFRQHETVIAIKTQGRAFAFIVIPLGLWLASVPLNDSVSMAANRLGHYGWFYLAAFSGIALCVGLARACPRMRGLEYLGQHTLVILGLQSVTNGIVLKLLSSLDGWPRAAIQDSLVKSLFATLCSIGMLLPAMRLSNSRFSWMFGIRS